MMLPVDLARLCPDCDILTESPTCPVCGRDWTFPLASWVSPLNSARAPASVHAAVQRRRELIGRWRGGGDREQAGVLPGAITG